MPGTTSFILPANEKYAVGSTVSVYLRSAFSPAGTGPAAAALTSAVVSASGVTTFTGLDYGTAYYAAQSSGSVWNLIAFSTIAEPTTNDGIVGVIAEAPVNVRYPLYGAVGDGVTDDTNAILSALAGNNHVYVPAGTYKVNVATIDVDEYRTLELAPGATLIRTSAASITTPVVRLMGANYSRLVGHGTIETQKASPDGVVHVGPEVQTVTTEVQRWWIDGTLTIKGGNTAAGNIGLNLTSSQVAAPTGAGAGSNYLGYVGPIDIRDVGTGIKVGAICNAHDFGAIKFHNLGQYSYELAGGASADQAVDENTFMGGFTHTSAGGANITVIKASGYCRFNEFYGVKGEPDAPGDPGSLYYDLGANTSQNRIVGFGNFETSPQGVDSGTNNIILDENVLKMAGGLLIGEASASGLGSTWSEIRRSTDAGAGYALANNGSITLVNGLTDLRLRVAGNEQISLNGSGVGFFGAAAAVKPTVTGSRGGNAALASLLTGLASLGLLTDSTTA